MSNSLDPDQAQSYVGLDLGANFTKVITAINEMAMNKHIMNKYSHFKNKP